MFLNTNTKGHGSFMNLNVMNNDKDDTIVNKP